MTTTLTPYTQLQKALFLDRDGVVIKYVPYLSKVEQVELPLGAGEALKRWQDAGYLLIIINSKQTRIPSQLSYKIINSK